MTAIITRGWLETWGQNPAPDLAYIISDPLQGRRVVTWGEVMEDRRKRQGKTLDWKRRPPREVHAYKLWVAYFDQDLMGGWQAFIDGYRGDWQHAWIDRDRQWLRATLMQAFPLLLPFGEEWRRWEAWKPEFARVYQRRRQDRRPLGVAYVWWDGRYELRPAAPPPGEGAP